MVSDATMNMGIRTNILIEFFLICYGVDVFSTNC